MARAPEATRGTMILLPVGDVNPRERAPVVNYALIGVNIAAFAGLALLRPDYDRTVAAWGLVPADAREGVHLWTFVTSMFLHGGAAHLLGNLLFLWITGDNVEDRFGHAGYLALYLAAGIGAGAAHVFMTPAAHAATPCIGASGAIAGVLGAYTALFPQGRIKVLVAFWFYWARILLVPAYVFLGFWFAQQFLFDYLDRRAAPGEATGVAYWAHIGGFGFGLVVALLLRVTGVVRGGVRYRRYPEPG
jgi:membrane associated rhomboid family serine protease